MTRNIQQEHSRQQGRHAIFLADLVLVERFAVLVLEENLRPFLEPARLEPADPVRRDEPAQVSDRLDYGASSNGATSPTQRRQASRMAGCENCALTQAAPQSAVQRHRERRIGRGGAIQGHPQLALVAEALDESAEA